jgi:glycosyltransferase involved in cell wall biosynthesis
LVVDDFSTDDSISSVIKLIKKDYANIKVIEKDKKIDSK